ncbi:MAG: helicase-associated domain-containing protein [Halobacteriota archaeon]
MERGIKLEERLGKLKIDGILNVAALWHLDRGLDAVRLEEQKKRSKKALIKFVADSIRDKDRIKRVVSQLSDREKHILGVFALSRWVLEAMDLFMWDISESELGIYPYNIFSYDYYSYYPRRSEIKAKGILGQLLLVRVRKYESSGPIVYVVPEEFRAAILAEFYSKPDPAISAEAQETLRGVQSEGYEFLDDLLVLLSHDAAGITLTPSLHEVPKRTVDKITSMLKVKTQSRLALLLSVCNALKLVQETYRSHKPTLVTTGKVVEFLMQSRAERVMLILGEISSNYGKIDRMFFRELKRLEADVWYDRSLFYLRVSNMLFQRRSRDWFAVNSLMSLDKIFSHLRQLGLLEEGKVRDIDGKDRDVFRIRPAFFGVPDGTEERRRGVIVQPNFEMIALPETPDDVLFLLSRFSETKSADKAHIFLLTRHSFLNAMDSGMDAATIIELLQSNAKVEIPQNVLYSLNEWRELYGKVELRKGIFLETDPELMRVIKDKIHEQVMREISNSAVILNKKGVLSELIKEEEGIFLEAVDAITAAEVEKAIRKYVIRKPSERIFVIEGENMEKCSIALTKRGIFPRNFIPGERDEELHSRQGKRDLIEEAIEGDKMIKKVVMLEGHELPFF